MRGAMALVLGLVLLAATPCGADEAKKAPDGTIKLEADSAGIVVGYRWGGGTLTYKGKDHPFKLEGVEVGDVGGDKARAEGDVYNLTKLEDFNGTYKAASANLTLGEGGGGWHLQNEHGVMLDLTRTTYGLKLTTGFDGIKITLK